MRFVIALSALAFLLLGSSPSVLAQSRGEIQFSQKGLDVRPAAASPADEPKSLVLDIDGDRVRGDKSARLALIDFTDYQ